MFGFFRRKKADSRQKSRQELPENQGEMGEEVVWIESDRNSWGKRLLDCRPITKNLTCWTSDKAVAEWFVSRGRDYGAQLIAERPCEFRVLPMKLSYPMTSDPKDGPVFISSVMEEKWDIFFYADTIFFRRSWTGELRIRARAEFRDQMMLIEEADVDPECAVSPEFCRCMVDFLIKSHMYRWIVPAPIPVEYAEQPKKMALAAFSLYGLMAPLATTDGTIDAKHGGLLSTENAPDTARR